VVEFLRTDGKTAVTVRHASPNCRFTQSLRRYLGQHCCYLGQIPSVHYERDMSRGPYTQMYAE